MRIALFGDSVFAGHGLPDHAKPAALLRRLRPGETILAAGVADETAADGLARAGAVAADLAFIEFGLNDAIQGIPVARTRAALIGIADILRGRGTAVVIVEALVPTTSHWPALVDHAGLAAEVARAAGAGLMPDILALAGGRLQEDGLHPAPPGAARIAVAIARHRR